MGEIRRPQSSLADNAHFLYPSYAGPGNTSYVICYNPTCDQSTFVPSSLLAHASAILPAESNDGFQDSVIYDEADWEEASGRSSPELATLSLSEIFLKESRRSVAPEPIRAPSSQVFFPGQNQRGSTEPVGSPAGMGFQRMDLQVRALRATAPETVRALGGPQGRDQS